MTNPQATVHAEVISVQPNRVCISVDDLVSFRSAGETLRVGSYLKVCDNANVALICIIESFSIVVKEAPDGDASRSYIIEAYPLGTLVGGVFKRGGDELAIPPKKVEPATVSEIEAIYTNAFELRERFAFSSLTRQRGISVPVQGDKFFNKHIAIIGATGSGKSNSVASILQHAIAAKAGDFQGMNNSHIIIFDIHAEYKSAFPTGSNLGVDDLVLPYWLLNDEEMECLFLESGDNNNYNQESILRSIITLCKEIANPGIEKIRFDSPLKYDINHLVNCLDNLSRETRDSKNPLHITLASGEIKPFGNDREKLEFFCKGKHDFALLKREAVTRGIYAEGSIDKFVRRVIAKVENPRLSFIFGDHARDITLEGVLRQIIGYRQNTSANVTVIDLSGIPFDSLSIVVSLITRLVFDYAYFSRRIKPDCDTPILLVYEEAHKYAPRSELARYKASLSAIERIAKEGRKYGVSLMIASQRPSEISETIFSQCSNFLAMRLTNPDDQAYVRRLLPDTLGDITSGLPSLECGEALLIGDATVMPCVVYVEPCNPKPSSNDIPYFEIWKNEWKDVLFESVEAEWQK